MVPLVSPVFKVVLQWFMGKPWASKPDGRVHKRLKMPESPQRSEKGGRPQAFMASSMDIGTGSHSSIHALQPWQRSIVSLQYLKQRSMVSNKHNVLWSNPKPLFIFLMALWLGLRGLGYFTQSKRASGEDLPGEASVEGSETVTMATAASSDTFSYWRFVCVNYPVSFPIE